MMNIIMNPVLLKELKVKMRGWKAVGIVVVYLFVIAAAASILILSRLDNPYAQTIDPDTTISTYVSLSTIQLTLVMFIAPALTASAISGERERQTLDLLLCTKLSPLSVILGKLFSSISHVILLIIASLPIFSIVFLFGGISIGNVIQLIIFYIVTAITLGAIGIFFSTCFKKTSVSTVLSYGFIAFLTIGMAIVTLIYFEYYARHNNGGNPQGLFLYYINPIMGYTSLMAEQIGYRGGRFLWFSGTGSSGAMNTHVAIWIGNMIFNGILTVILVILSSLKINPTKNFSIFKRNNRKKKNKARQ